MASECFCQGLVEGRGEVREVMCCGLMRRARVCCCGTSEVGSKMDTYLSSSTFAAETSTHVKQAV